MKRCLPFFVSLGLLLWAAPLKAQVATPSVDPAEPTRLAAASSWRFGGSAAMGSYYGHQETAATKTDATSFANSGLLVFQTGDMIFEAYGMGGDTTQEWDASSDLLYEAERGQSRVNLSVRGEGRVAVGLSSIQRSQDSRGVRRDQSGFGGSFGLRIGEGVFFAAGMNRMGEKVSGYDDKQWNEYLAGFALVYGSPESDFFRLEISGLSEPEVSDGDQLAQVHHKRTENIGELEVLVDNWLLSARSTTTKRFAALDGEEDQQSTQVRYGLGRRSLDFSWVLYRILADEREGDAWYKERYFKFTIGFGFL